MEAILGLLVGWAVCRLLGGKSVMPEMKDFLDVKHASSPEKSPETKVVTVDTTSTAVKYKSEVDQPGGLPPWPSGWKPTTVNPTILDRAWKLMPMLKDGERKVEQGPDGKWLSYLRHRSKDKKINVSVYEPKVPVASADKVTV